MVDDSKQVHVDDLEVVVDNPQQETRRNACTSLPLYTSTPGLTQDMHGKTYSSLVEDDIIGLIASLCIIYMQISSLQATKSEHLCSNFGSD